MNIDDKIELTVNDIIDIAQIAEVHGSEIIEMYLLGNRDLADERVEILNKNTGVWEDCFLYPWEIEAPCWQRFRISKSQEDWSYDYT